MAGNLQWMTEEKQITQMGLIVDQQGIIFMISVQIKQAAD